MTTHAITEDGGKMNNSPRVDAMLRPSFVNRFFPLVLFFIFSSLR